MSLTSTGPPSASFYRTAIIANSEPTAAASSAIRLGESVRALNRAVVGSTAPDEVLDEIASDVDRLAARLAAHTRNSRYEQAEAVSGTGTFVNHPMIGPANPSAPRIAILVDGDRLVGHVSFGT